ncbi:heavy-metal-associated domain-containing protein [Neobacillus sp. OS1-32]|uniref:Heavy-metal-associated domain-containing protein n=1 Tax=Neobacillus paridis TaxID=2803862 RepID=A0ABS1TK34_9BACI|nr:MULTISPECIES: heavy-metal-associated domain-containing protein [Neobacillus]MBL4951683.1 heavy-metal-associated domain-containing protein [Neobacillus paridis]WML28956.1 heavy-metal-associated domain-containing protein [Neobacillus sp. OS1-32]
MTKAVFQLEPLTCPSCIKKIENALNKTDGVDTARVLFNSGKVKAEFDESQVQAQELEEKIKSLGYPVLSVKVS